MIADKVTLSRNHLYHWDEICRTIVHQHMAYLDKLFCDSSLEVATAYGAVFKFYNVVACIVKLVDFLLANYPYMLSLLLGLSQNFIVYLLVNLVQNIYCCRRTITIVNFHPQ